MKGVSCRISFLLTRFRATSALALFAAVFGTFGSYGSHISGVDIEWECVGPNQFQIYLNVYRDCDGISMATTEDVTISSPCGQTQTITLTQSAMSGLEISQLCPQDLPNSTCNGGTLPGNEHYIYTGIVTLNPQCDAWTISWDGCCRNAAISNLQNPGTQDMYAEALIYTQTDSCNNSPRFTAQPIPYVCVNQPVFFNFGAYDPDGDSLAYSLIPARAGAITLIPYVGGYNAQQPIPGLTFDPLSGAINFTPTTIGQFVLAVRVQEFDSLGNIIGSVMRDIQFAVINCPANSQPVPALQASNVNGNATVIGPTSFLICPGEFLSFDIEFSDTDVNDTLTLTSNVQNVLPGATFSTSGINPAVASISWTATNLGIAGGVSFVVSVADNGCPIAGINLQTVYIQLADTVIASPDVLLCNGTSTQLGVTGGAAYQWSVLSGPPIVVGSNFSCVNCDDPIASPTATTTYLVESNVVGQCLNTDTVVVTVSEPFSISNAVGTDVTCNGYDDGIIQLGAAGPAGPPWTWELTGSGLSLDTTTNWANTSFIGLPPGTYDVTLIEPNTCSLDTVITIAEPDPMTITVDDTTICVSNSATVFASAGGGNGTYSYAWNNGLAGNGPHSVSPVVTTYYTVLATDQLGCEAPLDSFLVNVNPPLSLNAFAPDSICVGESAILNSAGFGGDGGPFNYTWVQVGTGQISSQSTTTVNPTAAVTNYTITITDNCGSPAVDTTLSVTLHEVPRPRISVDTNEACVPASIMFFNDTDPALVGNTCIWDFGDGTVITGSCGPTSHVYQTPGCYDVSLTVFSDPGCPGDTTYLEMVCIRPTPLAEFSYSPEPADVYDPIIYFQNESVNGFTYDWTFGAYGEIGASSDVDPVIVFPDDRRGVYPVTLVTTNIYGCQDSITHPVIINADYYVWIPNAFTPDGDGLNSVFGVVGEGISSEEFEMLIFNRWGELIFESTDPSIPWDGANATQGVYVYKIKAQSRFTKIVEAFTGHVTLLR